MMNLAFFGSSQNSLIVLKKLVSQTDYQVKLIITQPPRAAGRKNILTPTPVQLFAQKQRIPYLTPKHLTAPQLSPQSSPQPSSRLHPTSQFHNIQSPNYLITQLLNYSISLIIIADYALKIPLSIFNAAKYGALNLHPSLLPKYRGGAPVQHAILNGETETGLTIIKIDENFDTGKIVAQLHQPLRPTDTAETTYSALFSKGADLLLKILPDYLAGRIRLLAQDNSQATSAPRLKREDGFVAWKDLEPIIS